MRNSYFKWKRILPLIILMAVLSVTPGRTEESAEFEIFPLYPVIEPNVEFWLKIYTRYSSDQGVIHDKYQMDRIYGVIPLVDPYHGGGRKINNKRIGAAKKKYKAILAKLMKGKSPVGADEKRVAELFGPKAKASDFKTAMYRLRCQTGQKDRFRDGLIRSGAYIDEIQRIFRAANLPEDLVYLPHVESSFNPRAYSKFGAAGMWQFTRSTGKRFMEIDYTIDERRDPILSSHAAAKLLRQNYSKLNSWPMAITAYNHGVTGMRRAKRSKGTYERIFKEYRSRLFRFASRNFYSEFLAAREAAKNYRQYFGELKMHTPLKTLEIELPGYISLPELARHLKLGPAELRKLNPALRDPVFRGQKYVPRGYQLKVPDRQDIDWEQRIARLPAELYHPEQKRSSIYTVRRGDTAGKIAKTHGVKLNDLIAANNLNRKAIIYVNQKLRIPLPEDKPVRIAKRTNTRKMAVVQPNPVLKPILAKHTPPPAKSVESPQVNPPENQRDLPLSEAEIKPSKSYSARRASQAGPAHYRPQANQTAPFLTARWFAEEQPEASAELYQDPQNRAIPMAQSEPRPAEPAADKLRFQPQILQGHFAVDRVSEKRGSTIGIIRVEAEETLGHYAEWLNVSASEIRRLNGFRYGRPLQLSQRIKIPLDRVSKQSFEEKRFEFHQELAEDFFAAYRVERVLTYYIKRGDNIWTLSRQEFEVPLWLIKRYNGDVDFGALHPSQKLIIPIIEKKV